MSLDFTYGYDETPDCVTRQPLVKVNDQWPPPVIRVRAGEEVRIVIRNDLIAVAFTVHLHGFLEKDGHAWDDGVGMITSCPIIPDTAPTVQVVKAPEAPGTYLYHGHVAHAKVAGFTGLVVVEANEAKGIEWPASWAHDGELELLMGDSYHAPSLPAMAGLLQEDFRWVGDPQTVLMQGVGAFNCSANHIYECADGAHDCEASDDGDRVCGAGNTIYYDSVVHCDAALCPETPSLRVRAGQTYLLHVGNGGIGSLLNLKIEGHVLEVVGLDGYAVEPNAVESLDLMVGQRADILLRATAAPGPYWISAKTRARAAVRYGGMVLAYDGPGDDASLDVPAARVSAVRASQPAWDDSAFTVANSGNFTGAGEPLPDGPADRTFVFLMTQERFHEGVYDHSPPEDGPEGLGLGVDLQDSPPCFCDADAGVLKWAVERRTFANPSTPLLHQLYFDQLADDVVESRGYYELEAGKTYDVVLQNYPACNGVCEAHPWHLHGHFFWHVGTWPGAYDASAGYPTDGSGGGVHIRDTWVLADAGSQNVAPNDGDECAVLEPCGYTVLRFVADNPGAWCVASVQQTCGAGPPGRGAPHDDRRER